MTGVGPDQLVFPAKHLCEDLVEGAGCRQLRDILGSAERRHGGDEEMHLLMGGAAVREGWSHHHMCTQRHSLLACGNGTRFIVISFRSTFKLPSNRTELVMLRSIDAAIPFMLSKGLAEDD